MNWKKKWKRIKNLFKENSEEIEEEEEFEEFIKKIEKRMDKISAVQKAPTHELRAQVSLMFENAYIQKKISEANKGLKFATWMLAIATGILVYTAIIDSDNSFIIVQNIKGLVEILLLVVIMVLAISGLILLWKIIKILFAKD